MFDEQDFLHWCRKLQLSEQAEKVIQQVRTSEPSRAVRSGSNNVSGRYPSSKMRRIIQFESHRSELAWIYINEHDPNVIEFYDQPSPIKLIYEQKGRRVGILHTPDFFVIREDTAGWEECKMEDDLVRRAEKSPGRYCQDDSGAWRCPPGEAYAEQYGLYYRVCSSSKIDWTYQRNLEFLEDYLYNDHSDVLTEAHENVISLAKAEPGITLRQLLLNIDGRATSDDVFTLIVNGHIYADLYAVALSEPDRVRLFSDEDTALAHARVIKASPQSIIDSPRFVDVVVGARIAWDEKVWTVANAGAEIISLLDEDGALVELPNSTLDKLLQDGKITGIAEQEKSGVHPVVMERLNQATPDDLRETNRRYDEISGQLNGETSGSGDVPQRTRERWLAQYRAAEQQFGNGYIGLLPRWGGCGNRTRKLPTRVIELMEQVILTQYETLKQKGKSATYGELLRLCETEAVEAPSYKTFCLHVRKRPHYEQTLKRQGHRAAYQHEEFYWHLEMTTPRHGERPLHICHIDHTELDIELVCSLTGRKLGRPWLTIMTDAYSRRFLSFFITYDPPSKRSDMMVLRECVRRHGRLPQIIVVDGGSDFKSVYFETLLARYRVAKKVRPKAKARYGSPCERLLGTSNTRFIHNLCGNTQLTKNVRQVYKSVNPKNLARWDIGSLYERFSEFGYELYDTTSHPALVPHSPREAFIQGIAQSGTRSSRRIAYDEEFKMFSLPTTPKGTAKLDAQRGVKINYRYYWSESFRDPELNGKQIHVRYDPFDIGIAYALVRHQWVQCISQHYMALHGRSEKELQIATQEIRKRQQLHSQQFSISAHKLADFLASADAEEALLLQRLRDAEGRNVLRKMDWDFVTAAPQRFIESSSADGEVSAGLSPEEDETEENEIETYERF
jgi:transposase InsO family protein